MKTTESIAFLSLSLSMPQTILFPMMYEIATKGVRIRNRIRVSGLRYPSATNARRIIESITIR